MYKPLPWTGGWELLSTGIFQHVSDKNSFFLEGGLGPPPSSNCCFSDLLDHLSKTPVTLYLPWSGHWSWDPIAWSGEPSTQGVATHKPLTLRESALNLTGSHTLVKMERWVNISQRIPLSWDSAKSNLYKDWNQIQKKWCSDWISVSLSEQPKAIPWLSSHPRTPVENMTPG